jgi:hypothetical protein
MNSKKSACKARTATDDSGNDDDDDDDYALFLIMLSALLGLSHAVLGIIC